MGIASQKSASSPASFVAVLAKAAAWIVPHYCVLCGTRSQEGEYRAAMPLCVHCSQSLVPIGGRRCSHCGRELYSEKDLCYSCRDAESSCREIYPIFRFSDRTATLLRIYKSDKRASLAAFWAGLMGGLIDLRWPGRLIVPVPPRPEKLKRKEWDQIEAIAGILEKRGYRVRRMLERRVDTQQKRLNREMRKKNAEKAYALIPSMAGTCGSGGSDGSEILLIDDVYTTGATIEACAKALRASGAASVSALVIAID